MPKENENAKSEKAKKARSWSSQKGGATKLNRNPGVVYHQDIHQDIMRAGVSERRGRNMSTPAVL